MLLVGSVTFGLWSRWRSQRRLLARIRDEWGKARVRDRDMTAIASYHRSLAADDPAASLEDRTWDDLNLDAVFALVDRTASSVGQQALYRRMRIAPKSNTLETFEVLVNRMRRDVATRERAQAVLARMDTSAGYDLWWLAQPGAVDTRRWYALFPLLALGTLSAIALISVWSWMAMAVLLGMAASFPLRLAEAKRLGPLTRAFGQVGPLINAATALSALVDTETEPILGPLHTDLPRLKVLRVMTRWLSRDRLWIDPLSAALLEVLNWVMFLDANALYFGARQLWTCRDSLLRVLAAVGEVDAAVAVASYRDEMIGWTRPNFRPAGSSAKCIDLRHPLLAAGVPNSIELFPPSGVLITGSNMSGKSTFLRTAGVSAVLAQTLNTCLASEYDAPVMRVRSCIGNADDLVAGKSYYVTEVETILALVNASAGTEPQLFLLDELFRGTNAAERIGAGEAVLRRLVGTGKPHIAIVATHDTQLVTFLEDCYLSYHFGDSIAADGLSFDYRLKPGPTNTRNAIALLRLHGAPASLVEEATARVMELDRVNRVRADSVHES